MSVTSEVRKNKADSKVIGVISQILADTYVVYVKTQNFHWNIIDPRFYSLHLFLEKHYEQLQEAADELAERIRMLNGISPGSMKQFLELTSLEESDANLSGDEMLERLYRDHVAISSNLKNHIEEVIKLGDEGTGDLFIQHLRMHEKMAWMIKSHLS